MRSRKARPRLLQAMLDAFHLPDLRRRIIITLGILVAFRFVAHVPLPGVDATALRHLFERMPIFGMLDLFSGGAMRYFSVAALGVYPYITASIVMMLLVPVIPRLQALSQEGEAGRNKINLITHWLTVPMAGVGGYGQLVLLQREGVVSSTAAPQTLAIVFALMAGTMFLVWLGELITEYGIGNGISIIIFAGIVARLPEMIGQGFLAREQFGGLVAYVIIAIATIAVIVIFTEAHRRIPVQFARSVFRDGRMYRQSGSTYIPLRVNTAGMIPLIFAMSVVMFPALIASYFANPAEPNIADTIMRLFDPSAAIPLGLFYWGLFFLLTLAFAFFYTMVIFQQQDLPNVLQKQGGFIPGIRPGRATANYLSWVLMRITLVGGIFLGVLAVLPSIVQSLTGIAGVAIGGSGLLIVVSVVLETLRRVEARVVMSDYDEFLR